MAQYNQLTLLDAFDKIIKRDQKLVDDLVESVANYKYLRMNTRYSSFQEKDKMNEAFNQIMYWTAFLAFKKSRHVLSYKGRNQLEDFLALTRDKPDIYVTDILDNSYLSECYHKANIRIKTLFMGYKDILSDDRTVTKRILDNFDTLHSLTHVI
jgi:hypothetical protein